MKDKAAELDPEARRASKGKGKAEDLPDDEEDEEDDQDFDADEAEAEEDEGNEDGGDEEDHSEAEEEQDEERPSKKSKTDDAGSSRGKTTVKVSKGKEKAAGGDEEEVSEPEIVDNLSGDEVDPKLIIAGGRAARRGRAQFASGGGGRKYTYEAKPDSDEDSW